jgi:response regulator of citrate/malate metabolism
MTPTAIQAGTKAAAVKPRVLVVDDEADVVGIVSETVGKDCKIIAARTLAEAERVLHTQGVELLVTDVHLPDGDGTALLPLLRHEQPCANAIVITGSPSVEGAVTALRHGAVDFLAKPFTATELAERVGRALKKQALVAKNQQRIDKLRNAVRKLNEARKLVTRKVDLLCNDLITAYGELSKQLDIVRTQEGFKNFLGEMKDLEQLLCHTMDYLMRQVGYCNIAIWLAGEKPGEFQLGAYMKYTIAGDDDLTEAMKGGIVPLADKEGFVHMSGDEVQEKLTQAELDYLADQDVLAANCTYLGETLAVVVLFRDASKGFVEADGATLKTVSPLFAVSLAGVVKEAQGGEGVEDAEENGMTDLEEHLPEEREEEKPPKRKKKRDDADWWKNGEAPPF